MVPFSFERITRSAGLEALNAFSVSDSARATHESFDSHLQRATTPPPAEPTRTPSRDDRPRDESKSSYAEAPRHEPARKDSNETRRDEDSLAQDEPTATTKTKPADSTTAEQPEQDANEESEAAVAIAVADQQAAVQQLELEPTADKDADSAEVVQKQVDDHDLDADATELDAALELDHEGQEAETNAKPAEEEAQGKRVGHPDDAAQEGTKSVSRGEQDVTTTSSTATTGEIQNDQTVPGMGSKVDAARQTNTSPQRRGDRESIAANQQTDQTQNTASETAEAAFVKATSNSSSQDDAGQGQQQKNPDTPLAVGTAATKESTSSTHVAPSRFAQHLLARTGDANARGANITEADQARFVDRVARAIHANGERGGTLRIRLSPPELGSMTLEVKVQGGAVHARVEADTPAARSLLLENLPLLRERLAEQGMRIDQFNVDLSDRHTGGTPDGMQQNDQQQQDRPQAEHRANDSEESPTTQSTDIATKGNEQLNIIV